MLRRAIIAAGFAVFMLAGTPGWAQKEFDPETVELDEEPTSEPASSDENDTPVEPDAQPKPQPKPRPAPPFRWTARLLAALCHTEALDAMGLAWAADEPPAAGAGQRAAAESTPHAAQAGTAHRRTTTGPDKPTTRCLDK